MPNHRELRWLRPETEWVRDSDVIRRHPTGDHLKGATNTLFRVIIFHMGRSVTTSYKNGPAVARG